ncbi:sulfatase-like hydrolase/transferase [Lentisphaera marina]|uniref:sulfatase-like hydrolase/transferase n=1 Tax=Lentisphaera marina TaxID=1111041 RepID=UPI0023651CD7|nr:sulfatase-like hydrolase/transferase [Lentisphaera marina]MDD7983982.1 sulfatase-like hydrolase/transferase [Lentisphaera marina]
MIKKFIQTASLALLFSANSYAIEKPNIIIFYVDDLGWQDVQLNDIGEPCPYDTPNIVKLAEAGINFPQAYSPAPTCSASRAAIITGLHPAKNGMTHVDLGKVLIPDKNTKLSSPYLDSHLDIKLLTIADVLKANGYRTGHSGKWHTGLTSASYGFDFVDQDRGIHRGMDDRTKDFATAKDKKYPLSKTKYPPFSTKKPKGISYPYDQVTESAIKFMDDNKQDPFFLNLCHWMCHWPVLTRNGELLEYYCDKMGQPFPPKKGDMKIPGQNNPYFGAMVTTVDWSLGRVVKFLEQTDDPRHPGKKLVETTYIFLSSDNGGAEKKAKEIISDNFPLKNGKKYTEEGGIRVTTLISGPGIKGNRVVNDLVNQLDFFPSILTLTKSEISTKDKNELSGLDLTPVLMGESEKILDQDGIERENLFWHFPHNGESMKSAIREGDFKLYKQYQTNDYALYRLYKNGDYADIEENINLADDPEYASIVEKLSKKLDRQLAENNAKGPYLNPKYSQKETQPVVIENETFNSAAGSASLSIKASGTKLQEAYIIYLPKIGSAKVKHRGNSKPVSENVPKIGIKIALELTPDATSIKAKIPTSVEAYRFMLIDQNNYIVYSDPKATK